MPYPHLLSPLEIGSLRLRNRIAMSAMGVGIIEDDGIFRDHAICYYEERARGGAGLIITEPCAIAYPRGAQSRRQPGISDDLFVPGLRALTERVHRHGAAIAAQLVHHGKVARLDTREGRAVLMPSEPTFAGAMDMAHDLTREELGLLMAVSKGKPVIHVATERDLERLIADFADAAQRAVAAGFDAVELHAAHGYILSEFLSPAWNHRDDHYGGAVENRARLLCEVIRAVKDRTGPDFPVWCRIDAVEYRTPGGITLEDAQRTAELAVAAGADAINVSAYADATSGVGFTEAPLVHTESGYAAYAAAIKSRVDVPVIAVGRIEPAAGDALIRDGGADVIAMARKMLADPKIANKLSEDREQDVRPCVYCYRCVAQPFFDRTVLCGINPAMGHESAAADAEREPALVPRRVLIVGGGPAGLEAARVAARRGHQVVVTERSDELGGRLRLAAALYEPNRKLLHWMIEQVEKAGVEVRLNTETTLETVREEAPEAVLVAIGAQPQPLEVRGAKLVKVLTDNKMFDEDGARPSTRVGKRVTIIGGDQLAIHLADFLSRNERDVTVLAPGNTMAPDMAHPLRWRLLAELRERGVRLVERANLGGITPHRVDFEYRDLHEVFHRQAIDTDTVIAVPELQRDRTLIEALKRTHIPAHAIGDDHDAGSIEGAIHSGFHAAVDL